MYTLSDSNYSGRGLLASARNDKDARSFVTTITHEERVGLELRAAGLRRYELLSSEGRYLQRIIENDEHIGGVIFGRCEGAFVMLVATDRRVVLLDKKPLFVNKDEMNYDMIGGVSFSHSGIGSTVIVHGRTREYPISTFNRHSAEKFIAYIEAKCIEYITPQPITRKPPAFSRYGQAGRIFRR